MTCHGGLHENIDSERVDNYFMMKCRLAVAALFPVDVSAVALKARLTTEGAIPLDVARFFFAGGVFRSTFI